MRGNETLGKVCFSNLFNILYQRLLDVNCFRITLPAFTFSKLTIETVEQGVKYVQS